ncbi:MAG: hypothetical protein KDA42_11565 [Planctomycetales bacterium]|nr:hypothetical protein [Planctomycetales bacterium]
MMVDFSSQSLIAQFADTDDHATEASPAARTASRFAGSQRQQNSRTRFATQARYSRKRSARSSAPQGPRRRLHKSSGL